MQEFAQEIFVCLHCTTSDGICIYGSCQRLLASHPQPYLCHLLLSSVRPHATTLISQSYACYSWAFTGDSAGRSSFWPPVVFGLLSACYSLRHGGPPHRLTHSLRTKPMNLFDGYVLVIAALPTWLSFAAIPLAPHTRVVLSPHYITAKAQGYE